MTYFAYGSNLFLPRLARRCPSARAEGVASLDGWRLVFNKVSSDGSHKANIEEASGETVWGAVFHIDDSNQKWLRRAEGYPEHYDEHRLTVLCGGSPVEVVTYIACSRYRSSDGIPPYDWYLGHIVRGAAALAIPEAYRLMLAETPSLRDDDTGRANEEMALWHSPSGA